MNKLAIIHNLAKSGGTIISKCIGSMDGKALFSEIHPRGPEFLAEVFDPQTAFTFTSIYQAVIWHKLFDLENADESFLYLKDEQFISTFQLISQACHSLDKELVVRAWDQIDFYSKPFGVNGKQNTLGNLFNQQFEVKEVVVLRHPIPQWFSMLTRTVYKDVELDEYLLGYLDYVQEMHTYPFFKYENFALEPDAFLQRMCGELDITYDPLWKENWGAYDKITGDKNATKAGVSSIRLKPFPTIDHAFRSSLDQSPVYQQIIEKTGYPAFGF